MTDVTVHQITPKWTQTGKPSPYLNVMHGDLHVGVWTHIWGHMTYLLRLDDTVTLIQFVDQDVASEWLRNNVENYDSVEFLEPRGSHDPEGL